MKARGPWPAPRLSIKADGLAPNSPRARRHHRWAQRGTCDIFRHQASLFLGPINRRRISPELLSAIVARHHRAHKLTSALSQLLAQPYLPSTSRLPLTATMKIFYMGVWQLRDAFGPSLTPCQIVRNDPHPATELAVERDLSSFSRFTRDRYCVPQTLARIC